MRTRTINEFKFYFKDEAVVMVYNHQSAHPQYISFHNYHNHRKENMNHFRERIAKLTVADLNTVYGLAINNDIRGCASNERAIR